MRGKTRSGRGEHEGRMRGRKVRGKQGETKKEVAERIRGGKRKAGEDEGRIGKGVEEKVRTKRC